MTNSSYDCSQCHTGAIKDTSYASVQHRDLDIDVSVGGYPTNRPMGSAKQSCTSTCHGTTSPVWDNTASTKGNCSLCHGMVADPADGRDTAGNTAPTSSRVGAHVAHLTGASNYSSAISCTDCHTVPAGASYMDKVNAAGHIDGDNRAEVLFSGLSVSNSTTPSYNYGTGTCSTVYCHGGKMVNLSTNGTDTRPEWNQTGYLTSTPALVGDCNKCHGAPPSGYAPNSHSGSETLAQCTGCHNHLRSDGTFSVPALHIDGTVQAAGCTGCHGQPPVAAGTMVTSPPAGVETGRKVVFASSNEGAGAHQLHVITKNISCNRCHSGGGDGSHQTRNQITFGFTYGLNGGLYQAPTFSNSFGLRSGDSGTTTVQIIGTTRTCSNIYCHSSGQAADGGNGAPVYASANWDVPSTGACGTCHATGGMTTGSHTKHLAASTNCGNCHTDATLTTNVSTSHVNQLIDVASGVSYTMGGAPGNGYGGCTTASCHDNGRGVAAPSPMWGTANTDCSACHAKQPATGSHTKHLTATTFHKAACGDCHGNTVEGVSAMVSHLNGTVEVYDVTAGDLGYPAVAKHNNNTFQNCTTAYCHSSGQALTSGTNTLPVYTSVTWSSTVTCGGCHAALKADVIIANSGSHTKHLNAPSVSGCNACHTGVDAAGTTYSSNTASHIDGMIDVATALSYTGWGAPGNGYATCTASSCHSSGQNETTGLAGPTYRGIMWGSTSNCGSCHRNMASDTAASGSHVGHAQTAGIGCQICHSGYSSTVAVAATHVDGLIFTSFTGTAAGTTYSQTSASATGNGYGNCSTNTCHGSATITWGNNTTSDSCVKCHGVAGASPAQYAANNNLAAPGYVSTSPVGTGRDTAGDILATDLQVGAHQAHLSTSAYRGPIACSSCHVVPATVNAAGHLDGTMPAEITFSGLSTTYHSVSVPTPTYNYSTRTCSTTYCHDGAFIKNGTSYSNGTGTAPVWNNTAYVNPTPTAADCGKCHGYPPSVAGGHPNDLVCSGCHDNVRSSDNLGFTAGGLSLHIDGSLHGGGDACTDCHGGLMTSGLHSAHTSTTILVGKALSTSDYGVGAYWYSYTTTGGVINAGCGYCHPQSVTTHRNGTKNLNTKPTDTNATGTLKARNAVVENFTQNPGVSVTCSSVYCHSNGYSPSGDGLTNHDYTYVASPDWYGTGYAADGSKCASCHGNSPTGSAAHSIHAVGIHYEEIYTGTTGTMTAGTLGTNGHGNAAYSTTINCNLCHSGTVAATSYQNDKNTLCGSCHNGTTATLRGNMSVLAGSTTHVNGVPDVTLATLTNTLRSKAQIRTTSPAGWTRQVGYKVNGGFDQGSLAPANYVSGTKTCTTACHQNQPAKWTDPVSCNSCHTVLN